MKANFGLLPELALPVRDKRLRHGAYAARALADLAAARHSEPPAKGLLPDEDAA